MSATITSANVVLTTLTVQGTGGNPVGQVGVYIDNVLRAERATPAGDGTWEIVVNNLTGGAHTVRATDVMISGTSVITEFIPTSITVESPVGNTTEDITPVVQGTIEDTEGNPIVGATATLWYKAHASSTYINGGTGVTDSNGLYTIEIQTPLSDGEYDFYAVVSNASMTSDTSSVTVSKPLEAPLMEPAEDRYFAIAADSIYLGINPPMGYEVFTAQTMNIAKPAGTFSLGGSSLGLAIDTDTGTVTISNPAQFASAGSRQVSVTCTNSEGSDSTLLTLTVVTEASTTKYVDSVAGSDANTALNPNIPRATNDSSLNRRRYKRGGQWDIGLTSGDGLTREDYGDPWKPRPKFGKGVTYGFEGTSLDNATIRSLWFDDFVSRGINIQVVTNTIIEGCLFSNSRSTGVQGVKLHNSDKAATLTVPDLPGRFFNLIYKDNDLVNVKGDGLYITKINGVLIQNNKHDAAYGGGADCIQVAYENNATNSSRNVMIRGNLLLQNPLSQSDKGGLVCEGTLGYHAEYNDIGGKNFSFSSIGYDAVCRSNNLRDGRLNTYSFGYGTGEQLHLGRHHVYDNHIDNCIRGITLSSFGDSTIVNNGVYGYQRYDFECHDNIMSRCTHAFQADRPWSGYVKRNIFMQCTNGITRSGGQVSGNVVANLGVYTTQDVTGNYTNDGTWLNLVPPTMTGTFNPGSTVSVAGTPIWTLNGVNTVPDEIFYVWRNKGYDIPGATGSSYVIPLDAAADTELSCVMFARKGTNWMLAIAEAEWSQDEYFIPRAYVEGKLHWKKRYFKLGTTTAITLTSLEPTTGASNNSDNEVTIIIDFPDLASGETRTYTAITGPAFVINGSGDLARGTVSFAAGTATGRVDRIRNGVVEASTNVTITMTDVPIITMTSPGAFTSDSTPDIAGSVAWYGHSLSGLTMNISIDSGSVVTATTDSSGNFTYTVPSALGNGSHSIFVAVNGQSASGITNNVNIVASSGSVGVLVDGFETLTWPSTGGPTATLDTVNRVEGTNAVKYSGRILIGAQKSFANFDMQTLGTHALYVHLDEDFDYQNTSSISMSIVLNSAGTIYPGPSKTVLNLVQTGGFWLCGSPTNYNSAVQAAGVGNHRFRLNSTISGSGHPGEVSFDAFYKGVGGKGAVILTFDDIKANQRNTALPIMQPLGIVGEVYVPTALVGNSGLMTWTQIGELAAAGWSIQANGTPDDQPMTVSGSVANTIANLESIRTELVTRGYPSPKAFCYPFGTLRANGARIDTTATTVAGSNTVEVASATGIVVGMRFIMSATARNCRVASISGTTITLDNPFDTNFTNAACAFVNDSGAFHGTKLQTALKAAGWKWGRTTLNGNMFVQYGIAPNQAIQMPSYSTTNMTLASFQSIVNGAINTKSVVTFYIHNVDNLNNNSWSVTEFTNAMNWLKTKIDEGVVISATTPMLETLYGTATPPA